MRRKSLFLSSWLAVLSLVVPSAVRADSDTERRLTAYEGEARQIGTNLPELNRLSGKAGQRRLVDAEVAFSLGEYNAASLMLFELANQPGADQERATYYLAESLFLKGDKGAARTYYATIVSKNVAGSKYYQPALIRLVEIAAIQQDNTDIENVLTALNATPSTPEVPYVKGKLAFSQDKFDEAIGFFNQVAKGSDHELAALYFTGVAFVAKKDVNRAAEIFSDLTTRKPRTVNDRRVSELSHLALGRLFYERDQPSKAIESYLNVNRKSDLFSDALYEVAWVYVKGKQFDKALRALELLHLSNPTTVKTPTARILEGNLRIRKAQMLRQSQISGTIEKTPQDPSTEYDKAAAVFAETHDLYVPSYKALEELVASKADPAQFLGQISGRSSTAFEASIQIPDVAIQHLRDEPDVKRMVSIEADLGEIESNLKESETIIARLDAVLSTGDRNAVYPHLQSRRIRIGQIQHDLIKMRAELHDEELTAMSSTPEVQGLTATRKQLVAQYLAMPSVEDLYATRIAAANAEYDIRERAVAEVQGAIDDTKAMTAAIRKHVNEANPPLPADKAQQVDTTLGETGKETSEIETGISEVNSEIALGRDLAGVGDEALAAARELRKKVIAAEDAEHRGISASALGSTRDPQKSQRLAALADRALRLSDSLTASEAAIDALIDRGMAEVKVQLEAEKQNVTTYKAELAEHSAESRAIGGTVLGASFKNVKAKFYDIVIRADVGVVDVNWAQKEDVDDDLNRLRLSRQRELKQLKDEFKGILDSNQGVRPQPGSALPGADPNKPNGSPDKGQAGDRVKPGGEKDKTPAQPTVKPDEKTAPKGTQPKGTQPKTPARGGTR